MTVVEPEYNMQIVNWPKRNRSLNIAVWVYVAGYMFELYMRYFG